jgi:hypothetical protein
MEDNFNYLHQQIYSKFKENREMFSKIKFVFYFSWSLDVFSVWVLRWPLIFCFPFIAAIVFKILAAMYIMKEDIMSEDLS